MQVRKYNQLTVAALILSQALGPFAFATDAKKANRSPASDDIPEYAIPPFITAVNKAGCDANGKPADKLVKVNYDQTKATQVNCSEARKDAAGYERVLAGATNGMDCPNGTCHASVDKELQAKIDPIKKAVEQASCDIKITDLLKPERAKQAGYECGKDVACNFLRSGIKAYDATVAKASWLTSTFSGTAKMIEDARKSMDKDCLNMNKSDMFSEFVGSFWSLPAMMVAITKAGGGAAASAVGSGWSYLKGKVSGQAVAVDTNKLENANSVQMAAASKLTTSGQVAKAQEKPIEAEKETKLEWLGSFLAQVSKNQVVCLEWKPETPRDAWRNKDLSYCTKKLSGDNLACETCDFLMNAVGTAHGQMAGFNAVASVFALPAGAAVAKAGQVAERAAAKALTAGAEDAVALSMSERAAQKLVSAKAATYAAAKDMLSKPAVESVMKTVVEKGAGGAGRVVRFMSTADEFMLNVPSTVAGKAGKVLGKYYEFGTALPSGSYNLGKNVVNDGVRKTFQSAVEKFGINKAERVLAQDVADKVAKDAAEDVTKKDVIAAGATTAAADVASADSRSFTEKELKQYGDELDKLAKQAETADGKILDTSRIEDTISDLETCTTATCRDWMVSYLNRQNGLYTSKRAIARTLARMENPPYDEIARMLLDKGAPIQDFRLRRVLSEILAEDSGKLPESVTRKIEQALANHATEDEGVLFDLVRVAKKKNIQVPKEIPQRIVDRAIAEQRFSDELTTELLTNKIEKGDQRDIKELLARDYEQKGEAATKADFEAAMRECNLPAK